MPRIRRVAASTAPGALIAAAVFMIAPPHTVAAPRATTPVIGPPVASPSQPLPGKLFVVRFNVRRSDSTTPLASGKLSSAAAVDGRVLSARSHSFVRGVARVSLLVPVAAQGKVLTIRVTVGSSGTSATRVARFRVRALPKPALSVGDASVTEGNAGSSVLTFPVTVSAATPLAITVRYATSDGLASANSDYAARAGRLTLTPGQRTGTLAVEVKGDIAVEQDETLTLTLSSVVNATLGDATGTGTIANDDVAARSGRYEGSTSIWTYIAFDVAEGAGSITGLYFFADLTCDTPLNTLKGVKIWMEDRIPVDAEGSFTATYNGTTPGQIALHVVVAGTLRAPSTARGTIRVVDVTSNEPPFFGAHCRTTDVSWDAK